MKLKSEEIIYQLHLKSLNEEKVFGLTDYFVSCPSKDFLHILYSDLPLLSPDPVLRPIGDTTFFTSAGIRHLETKLYDVNKIGKGFCIYQPCIRTQYMDDIKEGCSTAFTNFSVTQVEANQDLFIYQTRKFLSFLLGNGIKREQISLSLEIEKQKQWGNREFTITDFSVFIDDTEVGMINFMHEFPFSEGKKIDICEVGVGLDRLNWKLRTGKNYFSGFDCLYNDACLALSRDDCARIIDPIRTATLITMLGIRPSLKNHGYRIRLLSKRFVSRKTNKPINEKELIHVSYRWWKKQGIQSKFSLEDVQDIIFKENKRNENDLLRKKLQEKFQIKIKLDINEEPELFIAKIQRSMPKKERPRFIQFIQQEGQHE